MIVYLSGMDIYSLSEAFGPKEEQKNASRSYRKAIKDSGLLFSYHYLKDDRPMDLQFQAWEALFFDGDLQFRKEKQLKEKTDGSKPGKISKKS